MDTLSSLDILTLTIYGEARGESVEGQIAVGCVIRNRLKKISYTTTYKKVCLKAKQFSCWNLDDPNRKILEKLGEDLQFQLLKNKVLLQCSYIAHGIYHDMLMDNTKGADHYVTTKLYNEKLSEKKDHWVKRLKVSTRIGNHTFLKP